MEIKNYSIILLIVSFLEGGALMATELVGAKLAAPFYGTSLYVWAAIFGVTLGGLALGYALGGKLSEAKSNLVFLRWTLLFSLIFTFVMPFWGEFIMGITLDLPLVLGILLSTLLYLLPPLVCFGMVSPIIIQILNDFSAGPGRNAGKVYAISTLGGVCCTFGFGFYFIPVTGLSNSLLSVSLIILLAILLSFLIKIKK